MRRTGALGLSLLGLGWLGVAGVAIAQTPVPVGDATALVVRYHEAARAAELCADRTFTRAEQDKLAVLVGQATRHQLPVGEELIALRSARTEMEARIHSTGCSDPLVVDALRFFDQYKDQLR
jgi:hypothetical protein